ncbi:hypothetical protein D4T97_014380 [Siminovitchia acidinfaciens]|uniref:Uncharacterized protein n=1 Tax=Siminovitchia acidinfaciens TaxID=2321395 RepID=A0A429XX43_9BACI|nr:hypothetical protein [Siminovitchia acidinfaciens]RST73063.1 hypothetical protein D4T97_014380 [Siminovitchia acidinfaciens]
MEIYFSPEVITPHFQLLNVVDAKGKAVGNVAFLFDEKKLYVHGLLEEKGVEADFKDLVTPYLKGLAKAKEGMDIFSCLYSGCEKIDINEEVKGGNE